MRANLKGHLLASCTAPDRRVRETNYLVHDAHQERRQLLSEALNSEVKPHCHMIIITNHRYLLLLNQRYCLLSSEEARTGLQF